MNTKYDIGQEVYPVEKIVVTKQIKCEYCEGEKTVLANGHKKKCHKCNGTGEDRVWAGRFIKLVESPVSIDGISILKKDTVKYRVDENLWIEEKDIFATKEEALAECERRNKEIK